MAARAVCSQIRVRLWSGARGGAAGAEGDGGAIYNIGYLILRNSVLTRNGAAGGAGGRAEGFSVSWGLGLVGAAGAQAGPGGASHGGAIFNSGQLTLLNCQCSDGTVAGGPGGEGDGSGGGGFSYGGALYNAGVARIDGSTCSGNTASGGAGGAGGAGNLSGVRGGDGGGGGSAYGGAVCNDGTASLVNSTLAGNIHPVLLESIRFPEPVLSVAIEPRTRADRDKMIEGLTKLAEEDPTFKVAFNDETGQTVISGMGELHVDVLVSRLLSEYKVGANIGQPKVAYKETITTPSKWKADSCARAAAAASTAMSWWNSRLPKRARVSNI